LKGHVKLGASIADLRDYLLTADAKQRQKILANPMAAKLGQGAGTYDSLDNWSGWVMENWQSGSGKREADAEGFLYAELETRFQGQLCLPLWHDVNTTGGTTVPPQVYNAPSGIDTVLEMSGTATVRKLAFQVIPGANVTVDAIFALLHDHAGKSCTVSVYSNSAGNPGTQLATANGVSVNGTSLTFDYIVHYVSQTLTSGTTYWVVIEPQSGTIELPVFDHGSTAATRKQWNGTAWANSRYSFYFYGISLTGNPTGAEKIFSWNGEPHFLKDTGIYKWDGAAISFVDSISYNNNEGTARFNGKVYIAHGTSDNAESWDGATDVDLGFKAKVFTVWNGYLWRGFENEVYYTADGTTWTGPITVGPTDYAITGMAGMGDDMFVATEDALSRVGAGDLVFGVQAWNNISDRNGKGMINHQGALYIPTYSDLLRYGGSEIMSINPMKDEGLPAVKQGRCVALASHNYWLFALMTTENQTGDRAFPILMAWNDQGWHYIGKLFQDEHNTADVLTSIHWDTTNDLLWVAGGFALYRYRLPIDHQNPYKDNSGNVRFFPGGMIETPWFHSGLKEIYKDCESVYITGENITSSRFVDVYWQDDSSTAWEYLGRVTSNRQELRWSDYTTRPNTRQIKLALVLVTDDYTESPRVDAVRLKFMNMVSDRWRWTLSIQVSDQQEMLDGELNIYAKEHMQAHLTTLAKSVAPIFFEDVDGVQYEVKVLGCTEQVQEYRWNNATLSPAITYIYSYTLEQATTSAYNSV